MASHIESDQKNHTAKTELTATERSVQKIETYYEGAELESARFQAFADYTDYIDAQFYSNDGGRFSRFEARLSAIEETIRQRKNSVLGYKKEFKQAEDLHNDLKKTLRYRGPYHIGSFPEDIKCMLDIKDQLINRKVNNP